MRILSANTTVLIARRSGRTILSTRCSLLTGSAILCWRDYCLSCQFWLMALKIFENGRQFSFRSGGNSVRMLRPFYAFLPTVTLCMIFTAQKDVQDHGISISWEDKPSPKMLLNQLLSGYSLVSYDQRE